MRGPVPLSEDDPFALRLNAKRDAAMQDAGWITSPQSEAEIEPLETVIEDGDRIEEPEEPDEQPLDEPEEESFEEQEEPQDELEEDFYLGPYKTRAAAEEGFAEKDRTIDRLFRELHQRPEAQPERPGEQGLDEQAWREWAQNAVLEGQGRAGAQQALDVGGYDGYRIYQEYWMSDPDTIAEAVLFNNDLQMDLAVAAAQQAAQPLLDERAQQATLLEGRQAKQEAMARHPDFAEYEEEINRLINDDDGPLPAETKQRLEQWAREGGLEGKRLVWEHLYLTAKAVRGPSRRRAQDLERGRRRAAGDAARVGATVSTAEGTPVRTPLSASERRKLEIRNSLRKEWDLPLLPDE